MSRSTLFKFHTFLFVNLIFIRNFFMVYKIWTSVIYSCHIIRRPILIRLALYENLMISSLLFLLNRNLIVTQKKLLKIQFYWQKVLTCTYSSVLRQLITVMKQLGVYTKSRPFCSGIYFRVGILGTSNLNGKPLFLWNSRQSNTNTPKSLGDPICVQDG